MKSACAAGVELKYALCAVHCFEYEASRDVAVRLASIVVGRVVVDRLPSSDALYDARTSCAGMGVRAMRRSSGVARWSRPNFTEGTDRNGHQRIEDKIQLIDRQGRTVAVVSILNGNRSDCDMAHATRYITTANEYRSPPDCLAGILGGDGDWAIYSLFERQHTNMLLGKSKQLWRGNK